MRRAISWQKVVMACTAFTVILGALYGAWGLLVAVDSRWEKAEAAQEKYQTTQEQLKAIGNILQENTIEKLEAELRELKVKPKPTIDDQKRMLELQDRIRRLEGKEKK